MPRRDLVSLTQEGLDMPPVDDMFNRNALNDAMDRILGGNPALPNEWSLAGIWTNLVRLTDKGLREYDAARADLMAQVTQSEGIPITPYLRAVDHLENCVGAVHRAVLDAKALREKGFLRVGPRLTPLQESRLGRMRNTIEHMDDRFTGVKYPKRAFPKGGPIMLIRSNRHMSLGLDVLSYSDLVVALRKLYRYIEAVRGPSVGPGTVWENSSLRTHGGGNRMVLSSSAAVDTVPSNGT